MIRPANVRECILPFTVPPATAVLTPTTTATLAPRWTCPVPGKVKGLVIVTIANAAAGNSTDLKDTLVLNKRGDSGGGSSTAVTEVVSIMDLTLTPDLIRAAGTKLVILGLVGNHCVKGEVLEAVWTETGTVGTATRSQINILGVVFEADRNLDPTL